MFLKTFEPAAIPQRVKNPKLKTQRGFTLIEILIVVAIIGILASIILVGLGSFRARGRDARRISDLRQTQNGLELYYTKYQKYPAVSGGDVWQSLKNALINAGIGITAVPTDPLSPDPNHPYSYAATQDLQNYVLKTILEDSSNPALKDSPRGNVLGIMDCGAPGTAAYCVSF